MRRAVAIVLALRTQRKPAKAPRAADRGKAAFAPGQELMHINLVADAPEEFVFAAGNGAMQRKRQLHDAEVRPKMSAVLGQDGDELMPYLLRQLLQLFHRQLLDVRRTVHHL